MKDHPTPEAAPPAEGSEAAPAKARSSLLRRLRAVDRRVLIAIGGPSSALACALVAVVVLAVELGTRHSSATGVSVGSAPASVATDGFYPAQASAPVWTPTPTPVTTPTDTQAFRYGEVVSTETGGEPSAEITVDAPESVASFYDGYEKPEHGPTFTTFRVTIHSVASVPVDFNQFDFFARSTDGARYQPRTLREPALGSGALAPGETVTGWLTFDAGPGAVLVWAPNFSGVPLAQWS